MLKAQTKLHTRVFFYSNRCGPVSGIFDTKVCFDHFAGTKFYRRGSMYDIKEVKERGVMVKIVVVKAPKFLRGILKSIFKIKNTED